MNKKLLLADDSITIQKVIGITFANEDVTLAIADNGDSAFEMAQRDRPDLIMADILMPGRNGYELCEAIKSDPQLQNIPVLLLSGTFEPFDEDKAKAVGADAWIAKPFESQALIDKVQNLLALSPDALARPAQAQPEPLQPEMAQSVAQPEPAQPASPDMWSEQPPVQESPAQDPFAAEFATTADEQSTDAEPSSWDEFSLDEQEMAGDGLEVQPAAPLEEDAPIEEIEDDILTLDESDIIEDDLGPQDEPLVEDLLAAQANPGFETPAYEESSAVEQAPVATASEFEAPAAQITEDVQDLPPAEEPWMEEPAAQEPAYEEAAPAFSAAQAAPAAEFSFAEESAPPPEAAAAAPMMSEEQMSAVVERVAEEVVNRLAGTILEKIAWEVVPDLAESLIKDEIRKIKEALK